MLIPQEPSEPVREADTQNGPGEAPGVTASGVAFWPSGMALSVGEYFVARGRVQGKLADDDSQRLTAPIEMRRVGWLDQRGRVWLECPPGAEFDGGSLTPLLVQVSYDD